MEARVGLITIDLLLPGTSSLKEKRARLRPVVDGIRNRFKVSTAEVGYNDVWDRALIASAVVSNEGAVVERTLGQIAKAVDAYDVRVEGIRTELL